MPPREPKGRMLVREVMADREFMTEYTPDEREAYLLLALFTDDSGWLNWDVGELAAAMFRYEDVGARESKVSALAKHLESTGRLKVYKCGHAVMPKVANRPRGMAREYGVRDAHQVHSKSTRDGQKSIRPPDLTLPNHSVTNDHSSTLPRRESSPRAPRGRARGGSPEPIAEGIGELKRRVGWGEEPTG